TGKDKSRAQFLMHVTSNLKKLAHGVEPLEPKDDARKQALEAQLQGLKNEVAALVVQYEAIGNQIPDRYQFGRIGQLEYELHNFKTIDHKIELLKQYHDLWTKIEGLPIHSQERMNLDKELLKVREQVQQLYPHSKGVVFATAKAVKTELDTIKTAQVANQPRIQQLTNFHTAWAALNDKRKVIIQCESDLRPFVKAHEDHENLGQVVPLLPTYA